MILEEYDLRLAVLINAFSQLISIILVLAYSTNVYFSFKLKQDKFNVEWGTAFIDIDNAENERVEFEGKPQKN